MGSNCCSQEGEKKEITTRSKSGLRARNGVGTAKTDDNLMFGIEHTLAQDISGSLYSDFEEDPEDSTGDTEDEETDWESYEKDVTFSRKGKALPMFKEHIVEEAIKHASDELRNVYKQYGPLRIKPKDVPNDINMDDIEFRQEGYK